VIVHYYSSQSAAASVADDVRANGGTAHLVRADLRSEDGCRQLHGQVAEITETLDVLVNNAGGLIRREGQSADDYSWALMEEIFSLNTFSAMMVTTLCLGMLRNSPSPSIVFVSSIAARTGAPGATIYGACKGAVDSLTRGLARELAPGIRVNAVAPGVIETPFHEKVSTPERMKAFAEATPLKRNGQAKHISGVIRLLIENSFLTGETIDVNGGLFMR
jgi:3-oxoacyl-[acyl-carrier protein] reductase